MFENRLKELRKKNKLTQKELGEILNVDQTTISKLETGQQTFTSQLLTATANYFSVTTDYLLGNEILDPTSKMPKDLKKILEEEEITLNGRLMSPEDKEKMFRIIEAAYWEAKDLNRKNKG